MIRDPKPEIAGWLLPPRHRRGPYLAQPISGVPEIDHFKCRKWGLPDLRAPSAFGGKADMVSATCDEGARIPSLQESRKDMSIFPAREHPG